MEKKSVRRSRFETVAARRTQKILEFLDSLSNCANRSNYEYTEEDVRKMFNAIKEKLKSSEGAFGKEMSRNEKNIFKF
jgi:hypothetical protein